jgi:hypothetical protein
VVVAVTGWLGPAAGATVGAAAAGDWVGATTAFVGATVALLLEGGIGVGALVAGLA